MVFYREIDLMGTRRRMGSNGEIDVEAPKAEPGAGAAGGKAPAKRRAARRAGPGDGKFCIYCGAGIPGAARFCIRCGRPQ